MARHTAKSHKIRKVEILVIQIRIVLKLISALYYPKRAIEHLFVFIIHYFYVYTNINVNNITIYVPIMGYIIFF